VTVLETTVSHVGGSGRRCGNDPSGVLYRTLTVASTLLAASSAKLSENAAMQLHRTFG